MLEGTERQGNRERGKFKDDKGRGIQWKDSGEGEEGKKNA